MKPLDPNDWTYPRSKKHRRRHSGYNPPTKTVCVTWPKRWLTASGRHSYRCWWETRQFKPGPNALVDVCNEAIKDRIDIEAAIRCAEAAGLFRKGGKRGLMEVPRT